MLKLNCDLGESFGAWSMGLDADIMPLIDQANIACGMHASDPDTLLRTVRLAQQHGVEIGAHPGYPDKQGFGRRPMGLSADQVYATVLYQIAAIAGVAQAQGAQVGYVKPHGALYHAMMNDEPTRRAIYQAVSDYPTPLALVMLANPNRTHFVDEVASGDYPGLTLRFEAFADRAYADNGQLLARDQPGAVHQHLDAIVAQAKTIAEQQQVTTATGNTIALAADTLCVHGDNQAALAAVKAIRHMLQGPS